MVNQDYRDRVKNVHKAFRHMQKPVFVMLVFVVIAGMTIPHASVNVLAQHHSKANVNTGYDLAFDSFESINATERSFVTSMDTYGSQMVGCAEFSGTLQNNMGSNSIQSAGGKDVLLFGWDSTQGYWQQAFGGLDDDFCWKVRWISQDMIGVSGYFKDDFTVGSHQLMNEGNRDAFFVQFNTTSQTYDSAVSVGTSGLEEMRSFVALSNGSFALVGSSSGDLTSTGIVGGASCVENGSVACTFILYTDQDLVPQKLSILQSTQSVIGFDAVEIGTSGKLLVTGQFTKTFIYSGGNVTRQGTTYTDIFVARITEGGVNDLLSAYGGSGIDEARSIISTPTGFTISGSSQLDADITPKVYEPVEDWQAPQGVGMKDVVILTVNSNGLITDGFTFGTDKNDAMGELDIDENGLLYLSGYIGSTMDFDNSTFGVQDKNSAILAIVDNSGGVASSIVDFYASFGSSNGDARSNSVSLSSSDDIWLGGRLAPGAQTNLFFGQYAEGFDRAGFLLRVGSDIDDDSIAKRLDNCPNVQNIDQLNYDSDSFGNECDGDDDNDGIDDGFDTQCPLSSPIGFVSDATTDHDGDGCADSSEDDDDDNDGYSDSLEANMDCPKGFTNWQAGNTSLDRDQDGCHDSEEDNDDDGDGFLDDVNDLCHGVNSIIFNSGTWMDIDLDGCHDQEDPDIDNDGVLNAPDGCDDSPINWISIPSEDYDQDGCKDDVEDNDDDNDNVVDIMDVACPLSQTNGFVSTSLTDYDGDGCEDTIEDDDNDNDEIQNDIDQCKRMKLDWTSIELTDRDGDGCHDLDEDDDDDNDNVNDIDDICTNVDSERNWTSNELSDFDGNGCRDDGMQNGGYGEDTDDDSDGINDALDQVCPKSPLLLSGDLDGDGCKDDEENEVDIDGDGKINTYDNCPSGSQILVDDIDDDGCNNNEDSDDDGDGIDDEGDACDLDSPEFFKDYVNWDAKDNFVLDYDQDGCHDDGEDPDDDNDGVLDTKDQCGPDELSKKNWVSTKQTDYTGNGCYDADEDTDDDEDGVLDSKDQCDPDSMNSNQAGWIPEPGQDKNGDGCVDDLTLTDADRKTVDSEEDEEQLMKWVLGVLGILLVLILVIVGKKNETTNTQTIIYGDTSEQNNQPETKSDQTAEAEEEPESTTVTQLMQHFGGYGGPYEIEWLVEVGDTVQKGQVIVEVTTDYATFNLESEFNGIIIKSYGGWRNDLGVGDPVMDIEPVE